MPELMKLEEKEKQLDVPRFQKTRTEDPSPLEKEQVKG
jgi:hypothetical protein